MASWLSADGQCVAVPRSAARRAAGRPWHVAICGRTVALIAALSVLVVMRCGGQTTENLLPDPISIADVLSWSERLACSPQQEAAALAALDEYQASFRLLREGDQETFLEQWRPLRTMSVYADLRQEEVDEHLAHQVSRARQSAMQGILSLDDAFFVQLTHILSEEQINRLDLAKTDRTRGTFRRGASTMYVRGAATNIAALYDELAPRIDESNRNEIERVLIAYEVERAPLAADLDRRGFAFHAAVLMSPGEATAQRESDGDRCARAAGQMSRLNRRVLASLDPYLHPTTSIALRGAYSMGLRAHRVRFFAWNLNGPEHELIADAMQRDHLSEAQFEAVTAIGNALLASEIRRFDQCLQIIIDWEDSLPTLLATSGLDEAIEQIRNIEDDRRRAAGAAMNAINDAMGQPLASATPTPADRPTGAPGATEATGLRVRTIDKVEWRLPGGLSQQAFKRLTHVLELEGDDRRPVVELLFEDYLANRATLRAGSHANALQRADALWGHDATGTIPPIESDVQQTHQAFVTERQRVAALDDRFFESIDALLTSDTMRRRLGHLIAIRSHERIDLRSNFKVVIDDQPEAQLFLPDLLISTGFEPSILDELDELLIEYERANLELQVAQHDRHVEYIRQIELATARLLQPPMDDPKKATQDRERYDLQKSVLAVYANHADELASLNRASIDRITAALKSPTSDLARLAWRRAAMPTEYADANAVHDELGAALGLVDLSDVQRASIAALAAAYRIDYDTTCDEMYALRKASQRQQRAHHASWPLEVHIEDLHRHDEIARRRFHRDGLNDLTRHRLRGMLAPEQQRLTEQPATAAPE